jgi:hypothetical protein
MLPSTHAFSRLKFKSLTRTSHIQARKTEGYLGLHDDSNPHERNAPICHLDNSCNFHLREYHLLPEGKLHRMRQSPKWVFVTHGHGLVHLDMLLIYIRSMIDVNPNSLSSLKIFSCDPRFSTYTRNIWRWWSHWYDFTALLQDLYSRYFIFLSATSILGAQLQTSGW